MRLTLASPSSEAASRSSRPISSFTEALACAGAGGPSPAGLDAPSAVARARDWTHPHPSGAVLVELRRTSCLSVRRCVGSRQRALSSPPPSHPYRRCAPYIYGGLLTRLAPSVRPSTNGSHRPWRGDTARVLPRRSCDTTSSLRGVHDAHAVRRHGRCAYGDL